MAHIARHEVTPEEVEEVCHQDPIEDETYKRRIRLIGPTAAARVLTSIPAPEDPPGAYYTVTARRASRMERRRYDERKAGGK